MLAITMNRATVVFGLIIAPLAVCMGVNVGASVNECGVFPGQILHDALLGTRAATKIIASYLAFDEPCERNGSIPASLSSYSTETPTHLAASEDTLVRFGGADLDRLFSIMQDELEHLVGHLVALCSPIDG